MSEFADTDNPRLLVVEDDPELGSLLQEYLGAQGYRVDLEPNGRAAVQRILGEPYALVILDLMLPGEDGFGICRQVRPHFHGRILMLTAREDSIDQVLGLELGADDYVRKPVEPRVLLARVRALLRRELAAGNSLPGAAPTASIQAPAVLSVSGITLDEGAHEVRVHGEPVDLTEAQFGLLRLFLKNAGVVLSRQELFSGLRGIDYDGQNRGIDLLVSQLRARIGDDPTQPRLIKTIRARGYLFARPGEEPRGEG
ncbi:response regulator transcription factor [Aquimonas voraii]|uniref:Two-component system, OmpR family, response regulator RstA n=1 Tax=Aquimonas voraii TaxID=265719 RepID=A0A1G6XPX0_9GAMM|nr:response regulator transcription factor [Aquimonas voraii]SDD80190.1 two-component system, OmpR family, response regulator RstA [Aquimonas voraii]